MFCLPVIHTKTHLHTIRFFFTLLFFLSTRNHRSISGATLTCPGPSLCRGSWLPNGPHHLHPRGKHHLPWQALHHLPHLTWYTSTTQANYSREKIFYTLVISFPSLLFPYSWLLAHEQDARHILVFRTRA